MVVPRVNSIVTTTNEFREKTTSWPDFIPEFGHDPRFLFLGEIPNVPDGCSVVWLSHSRNQEVFVSSTKHFRELTEKEVARDYF